jgi:hypothetical protein
MSATTNNETNTATSAAEVKADGKTETKAPNRRVEMAKDIAIGALGVFAFAGAMGLGMTLGARLGTLGMPQPKDVQ